jgi:hypothetical protein
LYACSRNSSGRDSKPPESGTGGTASCKYLMLWRNSDDLISRAVSVIIGKDRALSARSVDVRTCHTATATATRAIPTEIKLTTLLSTAHPFHNGTIGFPGDVRQYAAPEIRAGYFASESRISSAVLAHLKSRGSGSSAVQARMSASRSLRALTRPQRILWAGQGLEPASYLVDPRRSGRGEVQAGPGWRTSQACMRGLARGQVRRHDVSGRPHHPNHPAAPAPARPETRASSTAPAMERQQPQPDADPQRPGTFTPTRCPKGTRD